MFRPASLLKTKDPALQSFSFTSDVRKGSADSFLVWFYINHEYENLYPSLIKDQNTSYVFIQQF